MTTPMTAIGLSRVAKEANGDCWYETKPVYVRTEDGQLHAATGFTWDEDSQVFIVASVRSEPLAPEPADGTDWIDEGGAIFSRRDAWKATTSELRWYATNGGQCSWHEVRRDAEGKLRRLFPDPADVAPALPWEHEDEAGDKISVSARPGASHPIDIWINRGPMVEVSPDEAEAFAAVLLRAAREARK